MFSNKEVYKVMYRNKPVDKIEQNNDIIFEQNKTDNGYSKFLTKYNDNSERELIDDGIIGGLNAIMYSGNGLEFNGVDQECIIPRFDTDEYTDYIVSATIRPLDTNNSYSLNFTSGIIWFTASVINYYDKATGINHKIADNIPNIDYHITIVVDNDNIKIYLNNIIVIDTTTVTIIRSYFNISIGSDNGDNYSKVLLRNFIFIGGSILDNEVKYLYDNPESFLYREDNILKSKILKQNKIDKVIFYAPMCDNDSYIRDYSKYSVSNEEIITSCIIDGLNNTVTKVDNDRFVLHSESASSVVYKPYIYPNIADTIYGFNNFVKVTIRVEVTSGSMYLNSLEGSIEGAMPYFNLGMTIGDVFEWEGVIHVNGEVSSSGNLIINGALDGYTIYDAIIDIKYEIIPEGIYYIDNYIDIMNINKLNNGLQTCFWKKTTLGVPEKLLERGINFNSDSYLNTLYKVENQFYIFEAIYYIDIDTDDIEVFGGYSVNKLYIGKYKNKAWLRYGISAQVEVPSSGYYHLAIRADPTANIEFYLNGSMFYSDAYIFDINTSNIIIGDVTTGTIYPMKNNLKLFNIYKENKNILDLYNNSKHLLYPEKSKYNKKIDIPKYDINNSKHTKIASVDDFNKLNDPQYSVFFVSPGVTGSITLTTSGTINDRRYLLLDRDDDTHTGKLLASELVNLSINIIDADYWIIDRMSRSNSLDTSLSIKIDNGSNNIINRFYIYNCGNGMYLYPNSHNNTIQNCRVYRDKFDLFHDRASMGIFTNSEDNVTCKNNHFVDNEICNYVDAFQAISREVLGTTEMAININYEGTVVDNNIMWIDNKVYTDGSGNHDENGNYAYAENAIDIKAGSNNPDNPMVITNNKMWGFRVSDTTNSYLNDPGVAIVVHYSCRNIIIENNIIDDSSRGLSVTNTIGDFTYSAKDCVFNNNIITNCKNSGGLSLRDLENFSIKHNIFTGMSVYNPDIIGAYDIFASIFRSGETVEFSDNYFIDLNNRKYEVFDNTMSYGLNYIDDSGVFQYQEDSVHFDVIPGDRLHFADISFSYDNYSNKPKYKKIEKCIPDIFIKNNGNKKMYI